MVLYDLKTLIARYPRVALPLARARGRGHPFGPDTEIVIEGFPRTGSSFAVSAFELAQPRKPVVAHHVHAPAQVIAAARAGVPALVLIREPRDAVVSLMIRDPARTMAEALRGYVRFYRPLLPYRDRIVVTDFDRVVTDFGAVMAIVNDRFGTSFRPFEHTEDNVRRVLRAIEEYTRPTVDTEEALERIVARPSSKRESLKGDLRARFEDPRMVGLRRRAQAIYRRFAGLPAGH